MEYLIPEVTPHFKSFIISLLARAELSSASLSSYTDDESMMVFRKAFTHKSYHASFNYERIEFYGDGVINLAAIQYIRERFPNIISPAWLTILYQNFSGKPIYKLSLDAGFLNHILFGKEIENIVRNKNTRENVKDFVNMMEDTFEAFFGALAVVIGKKNSRGVGYAVAYPIYKSFYNKKISLRYEDIKDYTSRIKEIYDKPLHWSFKDNTSTKPIRGKSLYITTLYGYPLGDKSPIPENRDLISKKTGETEKISKEKTYKDALYILKSKYGIEEKIPPKYDIIKKEDTEENHLPVITHEFKEFIVALLEKAKVNKQTIELVTRPEYMVDLRTCFMHESYDPYRNHNLHQFFGVRVLDLTVDEYLFFKFPEAKEKWLTYIKQKIMGDIISDLSEKANFGDFIVYGSEIRENLEKYPDKSKNPRYKNILGDTFKAFMGILVILFDKIKVKGVGYSVAYNFFLHYIEKVSLSTNYQDVQKYYHMLKELYDTYKWGDLRQSTLYDTDLNAVDNLGQHIVTIKGYPKHDKTKNSKNEVILATSRGRRKKEAEEDAARKALDKLDRTYNIRELPPDLSKMGI